MIEEDDDDGMVELVVQGRTIEVSEHLLCQHSHYFRWSLIYLSNDLQNIIRDVFNDCDEDQETVVLKHKQVAGQDLPDERQQEPLSQISFITMTTIVDYLSEGILKVL